MTTNRHEEWQLAVFKIPRVSFCPDHNVLPQASHSSFARPRPITHLYDSCRVLLGSTVHRRISILVFDVGASLALVEKLANTAHFPLLTGQVERRLPLAIPSIDLAGEKERQIKRKKERKKSHAGCTFPLSSLVSPVSLVLVSSMSEHPTLKRILPQDIIVLQAVPQSFIHCNMGGAPVGMAAEAVHYWLDGLGFE